MEGCTPHADKFFKKPLKIFKKQLALDLGSQTKLSFSKGLTAGAYSKGR